MLNLPPPPNFRGLIDDQPLTVYTRNLPHWRQVGATYFVTFRLSDALPQEQLKYLQRLNIEWERTHPPPRSEVDDVSHARKVANLVERWSDAGYGACWFREPQWVLELTDRMFHFQNKQHHLSCYTIMPNHCHIIIRPFDGNDLEEILRGIKSMTARAINRAHGETGTLWQEESFDRIVRDEEHLWNVVQYIGRNPALAGLPKGQWHRWIDPDWQAAGWKFLEQP